MYQIVAISSKHPAELSLNLWIQRDAVSVGAVYLIVTALSSPMHIGFRVAAGTVAVMLIFALAHSRPRVPPETGRLNSGWSRATTSLVRTRRNTNCSVSASEEDGRN